MVKLFPNREDMESRLAMTTMKWIHALFVATCDKVVLSTHRNIVSLVRNKDKESEKVMSSYIGAIDQGTTSTRFVLYDETATVVASYQQEFEQIHPKAGWVEHDPIVILDTVKKCMEETLEIASSKGHNVSGNLKALGITNQRETTVMWSKSTGKPLHNAIVWMDGRTAEICRRLEAQFPDGRDHFRASTGLPISTYFSAVKILWLMENVPAVKEAVDSHDALFGTVESWLVWNLTGPAAPLHVTDCSNASRTLLMDLDSRQWDASILQALGIPPHILPRIVSNAEVVGQVSAQWGVLPGAPLAACLGDQHAALLGQRCRQGQAKATYGTGCFLLYHTGGARRASSHGLLSTMAFQLGPSAPPQYALEGSVAIAGAAVQWLRDSLGIIQQAADVEALAGQVADTGGLYFVPAFSGLFAPRWREDARGVLVGITRYSGRAHIARATLEAIAFQAAEVIQAMQADVGGAESEGGFVLRVDGGASMNNLLMQMQADLLGATVERPPDVETTALGAALAAGLAVGLWSEEQVFAQEGSEGKRRFGPGIREEERAARLAAWDRAVERTYGLAGDLDA